MKNVIAAMVLGLTFSGAASAAVLDFSEVTSGYQNGTSVVLSNATITTDGADIFVAPQFVYSPDVGPNGGFCGLTSVGGLDCGVDSTISFSSAVSNLMFISTAFDFGDSVLANIFNGASLLATIAITGNGLVDFSGFSNITSLVLDDQGSTGAGFVHGDFSFDVATVPLPAGGLLLLGALGGLAALRRRKTA